ncbi:MAG: serine/threonine protein kinase [Myxococcales bacterium]|nr:serine/threonine protein kinase [Myxococcales bacterium]
MKICPACSRELEGAVTPCPDDGAALVHLDTATSERAQNLLGQVIDGRYRLERVVGRGGMGTVYACRHVVVGKTFAMKVLRPGVERSEEVLQRFIREAQAANAIESRHICAMTDFGQLPSGAFYVVMELLDGMSLTRALREQRIGRRDLVRVFVQVADTLDKAHRAGIVHRDLKPDNVVLVADEDEPFFVKLVDFGIAKMMQARASSLTETGVVLGTPYYMSPEQARGDALDHRSDIYSLGIVMYRAFTGRLPFVADSAMGVLTRHITEEPALPSRLCDVEPVTERVILRCMQKRPEARYQSMAEVAAALRTVPAYLEPRPRPAAELEPAPASLPTYIPSEGPSRRAQRAAAPAVPAAAVAGLAAHPSAPVHGSSGAGAPSWSGTPGASAGAAFPQPAWASAAASPALVPRELLGEAGTHRGLVRRVEARPQHTGKVALVGVSAATLVALGGLVAFALLKRPGVEAAGSTAASGASSVAAATTRVPGEPGAPTARTTAQAEVTAPTSSAAAPPELVASTSDDGGTGTAAPTATTRPPGAVRSAPATQPTGKAPATATGDTTAPPSTPKTAAAPTIRSPFE